MNLLLTDCELHWERPPGTSEADNYLSSLAIDAFWAMYPEDDNLLCDQIHRAIYDSIPH